MFFIGGDVEICKIKVYNQTGHNCKLWEFSVHRIGLGVVRSSSDQFRKA